MIRSTLFELTTDWAPKCKDPDVAHIHQKIRAPRKIEFYDQTIRSMDTCWQLVLLKEGLSSTYEPDCMSSMFVSNY